MHHQAKSVHRCAKIDRWQVGPRVHHQHYQAWVSPPSLPPLSVYIKKIFLWLLHQNGQRLYCKIKPYKQRASGQIRQCLRFMTCHYHNTCHYQCHPFVIVMGWLWRKKAFSSLSFFGGKRFFLKLQYFFFARCCDWWGWDKGGKITIRIVEGVTLEGVLGCVRWPGVWLLIGGSYR